MKMQNHRADLHVCSPSYLCLHSSFRPALNLRDGNLQMCKLMLDKSSLVPMVFYASVLHTCDQGVVTPIYAVVMALAVGQHF